MYDHPANSLDVNAARGHWFKHHEGGKLCCAHCGQTPENFQRLQNECSVPQILQLNEPSEVDRFAALCLDTGAASFAATAAEAEAFRVAQDQRFRWVAPLPLISLRPQPYKGPEHPSFRDFIESRGELRASGGLSTQQSLYQTITNLKLPEADSLMKCYLRDGDIWEQLEAAAWKEIGHFVAHLRSIEPHKALCRVVDDIVNVMRERDFGPMDIANVFQSSQFQLHIRDFADDQVRPRVHDHEAVDRAAYWVLLNCYFFATPLRDHFKRVNDVEKARSTALSAERQSKRFVAQLPRLNHGASTWEEIEVEFQSDHFIQIRTPTTREIRKYAELGFKDERSGLPKKAWYLLLYLAQNDGLVAHGHGRDRLWGQVESRIYEIKAILVPLFGLPDNPMLFVRRSGYRTKFKISCGPSFSR